MKNIRINRRQFAAGAAAVAATTIASQRADAQAYGSNELIEAQKGRQDRLLHRRLH